MFGGEIDQIVEQNAGLLPASARWLPSASGTERVEVSSTSSASVGGW